MSVSRDRTTGNRGYHGCRAAGGSREEGICKDEGQGHLGGRGEVRCRRDKVSKARDVIMVWTKGELRVYGGQCIIASVLLVGSRVGGVEKE